MNTNSVIHKIGLWLTSSSLAGGGEESIKTTLKIVAPEDSKTKVDTVEKGKTYHVYFYQSGKNVFAPPGTKVILKWEGGEKKYRPIPLDQTGVAFAVPDAVQGENLTLKILRPGLPELSVDLKISQQTIAKGLGDLSFPVGDNPGLKEFDQMGDGNGVLDEKDRIKMGWTMEDLRRALRNKAGAFRNYAGEGEEWDRYATQLQEASDKILNRQWVGKLFPVSSIKLMNGKEISLNAYREKVVIFHRWATWCVPCEHEFPDLVQFYSKNRNKVVVIAVSNDEDERESRGEVLKFKAANSPRGGNNFFWAMDSDNQTLHDKTSLVNLPATFVIGPDGKITHVFIGAFPWLEKGDSLLGRGVR